MTDSAMSSAASASGRPCPPLTGKSNAVSRAGWSADGKCDHSHRTGRTDHGRTAPIAQGPGQDGALAIHRTRSAGFLSKRERRGRKSARARKRRDKHESAWCAFY